MIPRILLLVAVVLVLGACASADKKKPEKASAANPFAVDDKLADRRARRMSLDDLYRSARATLEAGDFSTALQLYGRIETLHPFTVHATQAELESIYAHYRAFQPELALAAADRFTRSHPRHAQIAYVHYLKGLIDFERSNADILDVFDVDSAKRDPLNLKRSFEEFSRLVQRFPDTAYAHDARKRMVFLKNRIAMHEYSIAEYYFRRRAYVAASRRALDILAKFQGTPSIPSTLDLLARSYQRLGLDDQAETVLSSLRASYPDYKSGSPPPKATKPKSKSAGLPVAIASADRETPLTAERAD